MTIPDTYKINYYDAFKQSRRFKRYATGGDFGGTKLRLMLFGQNTPGEAVPVLRVAASTANCKKPEDLVSVYNEVLKANGLTPPESGVVGSAGPPEKNGTVSVIRNAGIIVSTTEMGKAGLKVRLINDFYANACAVSHLTSAQTIDIPRQNPIQPFKKKTAKVVLGPGTGLGVAPLYYLEAENKYVPQASEAGHIAWAPQTEFEWRLHQYIMKTKTGGKAPSLETVASGIGLAYILNFFAEGDLPNDGDDERVKKIRQIRRVKGFKKFLNNLNEMKAQWVGREIVRAYKKKVFDGIFDDIIKIFIKGVALAARNAVLAFGAYDGVYLAGGNARRLREAFQDGYFISEFESSYVLNKIFENIPVTIVPVPSLGAYGAAHLSFDMMNQKT